MKFEIIIFLFIRSRNSLMMQTLACTCDGVMQTPDTKMLFMLLDAPVIMYHTKMMGQSHLIIVPHVIKKTKPIEGTSHLFSKRKGFHHIYISKLRGRIELYHSSHQLILFGKLISVQERLYRWKNSLSDLRLVKIFHSLQSKAGKFFHKCLSN